RIDIDKYRSSAEKLDDICCGDECHRRYDYIVSVNYVRGYQGDDPVAEKPEMTPPLLDKLLVHSFGRSLFAWPVIHGAKVSPVIKIMVPDRPQRAASKY